MEQMLQVQKYAISFLSLEKPWSTNEDRNLNPHVRHEKVSHWKALANLSWKNQTGRARDIGPALVRVTIPFRTNTRRDPANYCGTVQKAIIDGLVEAGAWKDDSPEYVTHLEPILRVKEVNPLVWVYIWLWEDLDPAIKELLSPAP